MIRLGTEEDIPKLIPIVRDFSALAWPEVSIDDGKIIETLSTLLVNGVIVIQEVNNKIVGVLGGLKTEILFSRECLASEVLWFVYPEHRGKDSLKMFQAFEYWANLVGCKIAVMGSVNLSDKLSRLYEKNGYSLREQAYVKVLK